MKSITFALLSSCAVLSACGGSSGGGTSGTPVVSGSSPTPSPSTPTPTPSPTATYKTYAELTGDQSFKTACASFLFNTNPPSVAPAATFGNALTLNYTAASDSYVIGGDGLSLSYGPADLDPAAPSGVKAYIKTDAGFQQRFTIGRPGAGGTPLDYTRGIFLRALKAGTINQYSCVFGVPTLTTDVPPLTVVTYTQTGVNGSAYRTDATGTGVYSLQTSTVTVTVNLSTGVVTSNIHLIGVLQTAAGAGATVDLGTFNGSGTIDPAQASFYGQFSDTSGNSQFAYFSGAFFGPQGKEAAYAFNLFNRDSASGVSIAVVGTVAAIR